jgi:hypothetical protein
MAFSFILMMMTKIMTTTTNLACSLALLAGWVCCFVVLFLFFYRLLPVHMSSVALGYGSVYVYLRKLDELLYIYLPISMYLLVYYEAGRWMIQQLSSCQCVSCCVG